ncbi:flavin monoamine oxidase family protein [Aquabacter spiritensis]|uniref:Tryptophan 2-monooxygenase n=1 Tax=Aquabacter spiritensis TaxID=933073 RepID=A0A4R3LYU3_9HYPH|nr:FAD-dependent oxidoreductase [Aquabacter spiritensis]TCT05029.1 monoamine oxidase [Aquabacter spiritensis]
MLRLPLDRRTFLAAAALAPLGAGRALGQVPASGQVDVVIVGAGAAGIAAARRVAAAGRTYALLEASRQVGGRAVTDTALFGRPFDLGAFRLYNPLTNPLVELGSAAGADLAPAPDSARLYVNGREAREGDYEDFVASVRRGERAIVAAGDAGRDLPAGRVLPDLGPWAATAGFVLGPYHCAKELDQVSSVDVSRAEARDGSAVARDGVGALVARLAAPLAVRYETVANAVDLGARLAQVATNRGTVSGRVVILAVPPSLIAAGKPRVTLPARARAAVERITLGAFDHIAFTLPGNPLRLPDDELVYVKAQEARGFALVARLGGSDIHMLEIGGALAQQLAAGPPQTGAAFLTEALTREFGASLAAKVGKVHQTRWTKAPFALGAFSCALPGAGNLRRAFTEVVSGRLLFAGEHAHETQWGTLNGAWASGERAGAQALRLLGVGNAARLSP